MFQKHPEILKSVQAKNVVRHYNRVAHVLIEYEMLYYRGWKESVQAVRQGLCHNVFRLGKCNEMMLFGLAVPI